MFSKLIGIIKGIHQVQKTIAFFAEKADRLDDDLDGNGKSELEDIKLELDALVLDVISEVKRIYARIEKLVEHVKE